MTIFALFRSTYAERSAFFRRSTAVVGRFAIWQIGVLTAERRIYLCQTKVIFGHSALRCQHKYGDCQPLWRQNTLSRKNGEYHHFALYLGEENERQIGVLAAERRFFFIKKIGFRPFCNRVRNEKSLYLQRQLSFHGKRRVSTISCSTGCCLE